ncbi:hypothetical protein BGZ60DRAFT_498478 [Tricladium varicosporioides]|nr:hypothetical protein BGZ60DRAFT_498478 [Hymenoscyphus varicosporioides]
MVDNLNGGIQGKSRPSHLAACEACRRLKMKCIRPRRDDSFGSNLEPCERCSRNGRTCNVLEPRKLGRKKGANGLHRHAEKETQKIYSESEYGDRNLKAPSRHGTTSELPAIQSIRVFSSTTMSNPLGLVAAASGAAQALERESMASKAPSRSVIDFSTSQKTGDGATRPGGLGSLLLRRPGYISLGLTLNLDILENGLDHLFAPGDNRIYANLDYFKAPGTPLKLDTGPDLDPVDLGLISMNEARALFPIYFTRLHPINGILDPQLHTPDFVRSKSALLFTWMLAITAHFDWNSSSMAKRLRLHGEKLSRYVHTQGFKSVEIVQGYYISLLSAQPAETAAGERIALYSAHAFNLAAELNLDQRSLDPMQQSGTLTSGLASPAPTSEGKPIHQTIQDDIRNIGSGDYDLKQRLARNNERTWLRILLWERANSSASGRMNAFPETELTQHVENWSVNPLSISTDKYTCAFIHLRVRQAQLYQEIRSKAAESQANQHWVLELVNNAFSPWCRMWLASHGISSDFLSNVFLRYVYMHSRLWTLSFALHGSLNTYQSAHAIKEDCFNASINCCEVAIRDLLKIGEPLYCMLAPTWIMLCYAAVLALKLFPSVHSTRPGSEVQLLALLAQVSLQLQRAGTTPPHRFGISALLGQHLMIILRSRVKSLQQNLRLNGNNTMNFGILQSLQKQPMVVEPTQMVEAFSWEFDPALTDPEMQTDDELTEEGFADILTDLFGQGFGEVS